MSDDLRRQVNALMSQGERSIALDEAISRRPSRNSRSHRTAPAGKLIMVSVLVAAVMSSAVLAPLWIDGSTPPRSSGKEGRAASLGQVRGKTYHVAWAGLGNPIETPGTSQGGHVEPANVGAPCLPDIVSGAARLDTEGDFGTITFYSWPGASPCSLPWNTPVAVSLIQASGQASQVRSTAPNPDLPNSPGPSARSESYLGFALPTLAQERADHNAPQLGIEWNGQYCGPAIAAVSVTYNVWWDGHFQNYTYDVPVVGGVPACTDPGGPNGSVSVGYMNVQPSTPLYPIPSDWSSLQVALTLPLESGPSGFAYQITLTNSTDMAIPLSPCPGYTVEVADTFKFPGGEPNGTPFVTAPNLNNEGSLRCGLAPSVISPKSSVVFDLQFSADMAAAHENTTMEASKSAAVSWAMPGIQTVTKSLAIAPE